LRISVFRQKDKKTKRQKDKKTFGRFLRISVFRQKDKKTFARFLRISVLDKKTKRQNPILKNFSKRKL
jgi:hypothetical protein